MSAFGDFMVSHTVKVEKELELAKQKLADIRQAIESGESSVSVLETKIMVILQRGQP
jgi:hypothetical protein